MLKRGPEFDPHSKKARTGDTPETSLDAQEEEFDVDQFHEKMGQLGTDDEDIAYFSALTLEQLRFSLGDQTILWHIALKAADEENDPNPNALVAVLRSVGTQLSMDDLRAGGEDGESVLWLMSWSADLLYDDAVRELLVRLAPEFTPDDLRSKEDADAEDGGTVLSNFMDTVDRPDTFYLLSEVLKKKLLLKLNASDWHVKGEHGQSPFYALITHVTSQSNARDEIHDLTGSTVGILLPEISRDRDYSKEIINLILSQVPFVCNHQEFVHKPLNQPSIQELLKDHPSTSTPLIEALIVARNEFFAKLEEHEKDYSKCDYDELKSLARKAFYAGYVNAYYDLGQFLESQMLEQDAAQAYEAVPRESRHFTRSKAFIQQKYFAMALTQETPAVRDFYLFRALELAIKHFNGELRIKAIQQIALRFVNPEKVENSLKLNLVPEFLFEMMDEDTPFEWCIKVLEFIRYRGTMVLPQVQAPNEQLIQELGEALKLDREERENKIQNMANQYAKTSLPGFLLDQMHEETSVQWCVEAFKLVKEKMDAVPPVFSSAACLTTKFDDLRAQTSSSTTPLPPLDETKKRKLLME